MSKTKTFTIYWRTGQRDVLSGIDAADALTQAGYGAGSVRAIDFHCKGDNREYVWDGEKREWVNAVSS